MRSAFCLLKVLNPIQLDFYFCSQNNKLVFKKLIIDFHDNRIPVYCMDDRHGTIDVLLEVLERKRR